MFTRKKIALFLLTAGVIAFLTGMYRFSLMSEGMVSLSAQPQLVARQQLLLSEGLITLGVVVVGLGSYLMGSLKKSNMHSITLDFTNKASNG